MKLRIPDYYKEFHCLADKCKDSCCIGWEIDIDEETLAFYESVPGDFGKRLRESIVEEDNDISFALNKGRCAFLNNKNLCDICIELGETALCDICLEYPRFTIEYGNIREKCLGISCEEVGRLIFEKKDTVIFEETVIREQFEWQDDEEEYSEEEEEMNHSEYPYLEKARAHAIWILQNRNYKIEDRACICMQFAEEIQCAMNNREFKEFDFIIATYKDCIEEKIEKYHLVEADIFKLYKTRMDIYENLELLDEEWEQVLQKMRTLYTTADVYEKLHHKLAVNYKEREIHYEQLLVYFVFRYGMKAVYDYNFLEKIKFAMISFVIIRDMDAERFHRENKFGVEERIDVARIYSKEVEHSEDNLEILAEACVFEEAFQTEFIIKSIRG